MFDSIKLILVSILSLISSFLPFRQLPPLEKSSYPLSPVAISSSMLKTEENMNPVTLEVRGEKYNAYYFWVENIRNLSLYSNFIQKQTTGEIINLRKCSAFSSGSFYSKDNSPIGLFVSQSKKISSATFNSLLNGFFYLRSDQVVISSEPPVEEATWALQSGPILYENAQAKHLRIKNDENARRIVAATTKDNKLLFIAFYEPQNNLQGPFLAYLPEYLREFSYVTGLKIKNGINLDGGSASAFYANNFFLPEFNSVGSYFCLK